MQCPCDSSQEYENCCGPYIEGNKKPETAEQLMRARYSAYALENMDFIENTHDPKKRGELDMDANRQWAQSTKWLGLEVLGTEDGGPDDETGMVEFRAKFDSGDGEQLHHERSLFNKRKGTWYFSDGKDPSQQTFVRSEPKVGRNDPCPCGSGKKYKKCCGKA